MANILLEIAGDPSDGKRALAEMARELAMFSREEAEAAAYVDTSEANRELDELKVALERVDAKKVAPEVNVRIAKAQTDIAVLKAELEKLDGEDVEVDVDVKRGVAEKLGALSGLITKIGQDTEDLSGGPLRNFISRIGESADGASLFGVSLGKIALAAPIVIAVLVAVVGQLVAVVASAVSAAGGLAALAVAFGATLVPGILLGIGAIAKFAAESETAGTAAYALAGNLKDVWNTFQNATAGGANEVFQGLSDALRDLDPLVESLRPAFTRLGEAGGNALRMLGEHFSSPAWREFFVFVTDSLAKLSPLMARSFGAFADILRNIATAAMPFLIDGLRSVAEFLEGIADKTSDIGGLQKVIGGMVDSLSAWLDLLGGAADLVGAFVGAFAPLGDGIVESLAEGAHNLADWLRSGDGLDEVKQFFEQTGPLAGELGKLVLQIGLALIQIAEIVAPVLAPVVHLLNKIFEAANKALSYLADKVPGVAGALTGVVSPIAAIAAAFPAVKQAAADAFTGVKQAASDAWGGVKSAASDSFDWIKGAAPKIFDAVFAALTAPIRFQIEFAQDIAGRARNIWEAVKGVISDGIKFVISFAEGIVSRARTIWSAVKGVVTDVIKFVLQFADGIAGRARSIWSSVKGVITDAISFVFSLPSEIAGRARDLWSTVKGVISDAIQFVIDLPGVGGLVSAARAIWDAINDALPDIEISIHIPTPSLPDIPGAATGVRDLAKGGLRRVGEEGEELMFVPTGADIYTAAETRNILRALASGAVAPAASPVSSPVPAVVGGNGVTIGELKVVSPGTGSPDPDVALAQISARLRARGIL